MADEGASPREQIIEACRRNNTELLLEVISSTNPKSPQEAHEDAVAALLNHARDSMGNAALHIAAGAGSYETIDLILDQPGVETDPLTRIDLSTPLHSAVLFSNTLPPGTGKPLIELLLDAGCDPRIRNKAKMKPVDLVDPRDEELKGFLRTAEVMVAEGINMQEEEADEGANGTVSDSD